MTVSAAAASSRRTEVYRVMAPGLLEHRWLDTSDAGAVWTDWVRAPFPPTAVVVAAISGWDEQLEVFVVDRSGQVWNRRWWHGRGWEPADRFNPLGAPFGTVHPRSLAALSAGGGHFNVFVEDRDGRLAMLPHVNGSDGPHWRRCGGPEALRDGWWPAFHVVSSGGYRRTHYE